MTLFLILKAKYFNQIAEGVKTEEFREVKPYWTKRLSKKYDKILFQEGYDKSKRLEASFEGYYKKTIEHEHFGGSPLEVYAIKFKLNE